MNNLFVVVFNSDGTMKSATLRSLRPDKKERMEMWEAWEWFQTLEALGKSAIEQPLPDGGLICSFIY